MNTANQDGQDLVASSNDKQNKSMDVNQSLISAGNQSHLINEAATANASNLTAGGIAN